MFIVVTKSSFTSAVAEEVMSLTERALPVARRQPGFKSMTVHLAHDKSHTLTYWVWETEANHLACMASGDWADFNARWETLVGSGHMRFELATYDIIHQQYAE